MMETCEQCKTTSIVYTEYHSRVCTRCGLEDFARILDTEHSYGAYAIPLISEATYTRVKRFKKYLMRAAMEQSANTIPEATWNYLLGGQPYRGPASIVRRLKKAPKTVRKKCYDSLPLLVKMLCPHIRVRRSLNATNQTRCASFRRSTQRTARVNRLFRICMRSSIYWS